jgi:hypothetical protein
MVPTSNTYQFGNNTQVDDLFREAFERIGIVGNEQSPLQVQSALMSANLELSSWPGRGLNLWLIQQQMFSLIANQPIYVLPQYTVQVMELVATQLTRLNLGGSAFSSSTAFGSASNCFDPNQTAGCTLNVINGSIGYDYGAGNTNSIMYVGITPLATSTYTLTVQYTFDDPSADIWTTVYIAPTQSYPAYQTTWFVVEQALNARAWRITETGGATLAIQQIYFSQPNTTGVGDRLLTALSRSEWLAIATKLNTSGYPSGYYFDQTTQAPSLSPTIRMWPVPGPAPNFQPTNILYTNYRYAQDVTQMFQNAELPQRFYDALVAGLSSRLAMKFAPDRYQLMKAEAMEAYKIAAQTDAEKVTLRFTPDISQYSPK